MTRKSQRSINRTDTSALRDRQKAVTERASLMREQIIMRSMVAPLTTPTNATLSVVHPSSGTPTLVSVSSVTTVGDVATAVSESTGTSGSQSYLINVGYTVSNSSVGFSFRPKATDYIISAIWNNIPRPSPYPSTKNGGIDGPLYIAFSSSS